MSARELLQETRGHAVLLTFNRPERKNALCMSLVAELRQALGNVAGADDVWAVILTGAGDAFCAGADLRERRELDDRAVFKMRHELLFPFFRDLDSFPKPMIAAVNGPCLGGGLEVAMGCDLRLCSPEATFGSSEVRWGIMAGGGVLQRLRLTVGMGWAKEMALTGRVIDAGLAREIGLVTRVVPRADLVAQAWALADEVCANGPFAVAQTKKSLNGGADIAAAVRFDMEASEGCYHTEDRLEGMRAFNEKRSPRYRGY